MLNKFGKEGTYPQIIKAIFVKLTPNINLKSEKLKLLLFSAPYGLQHTKISCPSQEWDISSKIKDKMWVLTLTIFI